MAILPIVQWPDERLTITCRPVEDIAEVGTLPFDMLDTMYAAPGRGLAAPQVGELMRLFVMDVGWKDGTKTPLVMINPRILFCGAEQEQQEEGCLSIPGFLVPVLRPKAVKLTWIDESGREHVGAFDGFAARCIQHELDHLDGRITLDHLSAEARLQADAEYTQKCARNQ